MQVDIRMNTDVYVSLDQLVIEGCMYIEYYSHLLSKMTSFHHLMYISNYVHAVRRRKSSDYQD